MRRSSTLPTAAIVLALGAGALLAGCSSPPPFDPTSPGPLLALPPCTTPPAAAQDADVDGLILPEGGVVTMVQPGEPLVTVQAYVPATPIAIREELIGRPDLTVFVQEDEVYEAEVLVGDGTHRTYLKATAVCDEGSTLLAVVAPELDAAGLPVSASTTATPSPAP